TAHVEIVTAADPPSHLFSSPSPHHVDAACFSARQPNALPFLSGLSQNAWWASGWFLLNFGDKIPRLKVVHATLLRLGKLVRQCSQSSLWCTPCTRIIGVPPRYAEAVVAYDDRVG
ncbi:hypothetical protein A0H81_09704, partial [Grifola frondosa]